nr:tRNA (adenosine(37)-N6)-dimethylallyltransferase MiaA [Terrimesophilobacter mesophilus]
MRRAGGRRRRHRTRLARASDAATVTAPLLAIVGATGTGKSALSLDVAQRLDERGHPAEIINADAMQLYRGMDIGTAKLAVEERRGIPHHLFDVLDVTQEASVADYQERALGLIAAVRERGAVPILVGGSGLYVSSVLFDFHFPGTDPDIRARLEAELETRGRGILYRRLAELDPDAADAIGPHNARRIVRALEVVELTGEPFGSGLPDESRMRESALVIGLTSPRPALVAGLDARVQGMWQAGLLDEVRGLLDVGLEHGVTARRAIGYAQAIGQLRGSVTEVQAIEDASALTRRYARRQVGWFRRYRDAHWFDAEDPRRVDATVALALAHG